MALVICLAILVLITAAVLAFFTRATANRVTESSRANRVRTEQLTQSSADYVIGTLLQEIASPANSSNSVYSGVTIYHPKAATNVIPARKLGAAISPTDTIFFNLIRQSAPGADTNASTASSGAPAKNGRLVGPARWNVPTLIPGAGFSTNSQLPNWIYIAADGSVSATLNASTIGRFAYNVYNEGGLLDANCAGYPSFVGGTNLTAIKSTLAGADLTQLGVAQASIDQLVAFRNPGVTTADQYVERVVNSSRDGFKNRIGATYTNNLFASRQDLIRYARSENPGLTNALPYLGASIYGLTSPSFAPDPARPKVAGVPAGSDERFNPGLLSIRVNGSFTRLDGSSANIGDPLVLRRFPLERMKWIGRSGPAAGATAAQVEQAFGLAFAGGKWTYVHGNGNIVRTLEEVRDLPTKREPDFFELLQAGILLGSTSKSGGGSAAAQLLDTSLSYQILKIGANLIDQADENSFPTLISFGGREFYGVENLPYLYRVFLTPYRLQGSSQPSNRANAGLWFLPEIWNPHTQTPVPSADGPTRFRFVMTGLVAAGFGYTSADDIAYPEGYTYAAQKTFPDPNVDISGGIQFTTTSMNYVRPTPLLTSNGATATGADYLTDDGALDILGIHAGTADVPDQRFTADPDDNFYKYGTVLFQTPANFVLQYWDGAAWVTYSQVPYVDSQAYDGERPEGNRFERFYPASFYSLIDPRTSRFGPSVGFVELEGSPNVLLGPGYNSGLTQRPTVAVGAQRHGGVSSWPGWTFGGPAAVATPQGYFGTLTDNRSTSVCRYTDWDGVQRPADGAYATPFSTDGYPLATDNFNSRPVVLNRPFYSVGEMAFASRDVPWKHLDFFAKESADSALLDLFCVQEGSESTRGAVEAGVVDLNTRQAGVVRALLANAGKTENGDTISAADAQTLANSLVARTADPARGPLVNKNELVTKWAQDLNYATAADRTIKRRREAAIRVLGSVGSTRNWVLLIDIVAQAGKVATSDPSAFQVDGEQRSWIHVVIDRPTGKVIERFDEIVLE